MQPARGYMHKEDMSELLIWVTQSHSVLRSNLIISEIFRRNCVFTKGELKMADNLKIVGTISELSLTLIPVKWLFCATT
jgi:hypothetical protein